MTLGDAIADALPRLRAEAESRMRSACTITRASTAAPGIDEATGKPLPAAGTEVYSGRCRVQLLEVVPRDAEAGGDVVAVQAVTLHLPVDGTGTVRLGDVVTVTASPTDASLVGVQYVVGGLHHKDDATARRLRCEQVNRRGD